MEHKAGVGDEAPSVENLRWEARTDFRAFFLLMFVRPGKHFNSIITEPGWRLSPSGSLCSMTQQQLAAVSHLLSDVGEFTDRANTTVNGPKVPKRS